MASIRRDLNQTQDMSDSYRLKLPTAVLGHRAQLALFPVVELPYPVRHWLVEAKHSAVIGSLADAERKLTLESQL